MHVGGPEHGDHQGRTGDVERGPGSGRAAWLTSRIFRSANRSDGDDPADGDGPGQYARHVRLSSAPGLAEVVTVVSLSADSSMASATCWSCAPSASG